MKKKKLKHGRYCRTNRTGIIIIDGKYHKGKRSGTWIYRSANGGLDKIQIYKKGIIIEKRIYYFGRVGGDLVDELCYENGKVVEIDSREYDMYVDPPKYQSGEKDLNDFDVYEANEFNKLGEDQ